MNAWGHYFVPIQSGFILKITKLLAADTCAELLSCFVIKNYNTGSNHMIYSQVVIAMHIKSYVKLTFLFSI